jgi:hypothetical protein
MKLVFHISEDGCYGMILDLWDVGLFANRARHLVMFDGI